MPPTIFRDPYHDAPHELVVAQTKGLALTPRAITEPPRSSIQAAALLLPRRGAAEQNCGKVLNTELLRRLANARTRVTDRRGTRAFRLAFLGISRRL